MDVTLFDGNENHQPTEGSIQRQPKNRSERMMWRGFEATVVVLFNK